MSRLIAHLAEKMIQKKLKLSLAESCTGGQIASLITSRSGSSKYFLGGVVSYANEAKRDLLGVKSATLKKFGAVSKETAIQMARGSKKIFRSDWALAVTGVAGPSGGTKEKPVGLVYVALVGPKIEKVKKLDLRGSRHAIQKNTAILALEFLSDTF